MKNKINKRFNKLELDRKILFSKLEKIDNEILNYNPQQDKWSIIQIIHHLYKSDQLSIVYIKRKLRDTQNISKSSLGSLVRGVLLEWALRFPKKLKAPANVSDVPKKAELELYSEKWVRIRSDLFEIIENTDVNILNRNIFRHPSAGEMNMVHALKFMQAHFDNHKKQIDNILQIKNNLV